MLLFTLPMVLAVGILFMRTVHPLSMGLILLCQTCLICVFSGLVSSSFWFSYVLFLVFLGGMLVLFIYVASLASNEPFVFSLSLSVVVSVLFFFGLSMLMIDPLSLSTSIVIMSSNSVEGLSTLMLVSMIYSVTMMSFTLYVVIYLLLTLLVVVSITGSYFGPLRLSV